MKVDPKCTSLVRLTTGQVAKRLGVTVTAARRLIVDGPLDGIKVGRRIYVEVQALTQFLSARAA